MQKAVQNAKGLYQRWGELLHDPMGYSREELDWTSNELRNSVRSIEWDLEDLEETISIVEKNPRKFKIDEQEIKDRRDFVERTKATVRVRYHYVHPPGGWIYYFCFFRRPMSVVRCPASGVRCPASRMVSAHLKEKY